MRLSRSIVGEKEASAVSQVICEEGYLGMGKTTREFEKAVANYLGIEPWQAISVNSGTAALHLACQAVRVMAKNHSGNPEVLVPTLTYVASFQAILAAGMKPVACDVLQSTGTLDLEDAKKRLTDNTVAVMHVDYASNPWHLDKVYEFGIRNKIRVIDDAAHAFGCKHHGKKIGSFGDLVCFSFDGIKNITCGEGGMAVAFDETSARLMADARLLGVEGDTEQRFKGGRSWNPDVHYPGWRYHMSNIMAAIGLTQLNRLENEFIPARRHLYELYCEQLKDCPNLEIFEIDPNDYIVPHIMPVKILHGLRDQVVSKFKEADIPTGMHYKPNHLLSLFGGGYPSLPNAEKLYQEIVTLPLHPGLTEEDVAICCNLLKNILSEVK